jgi:hypothetical protein
MLQKVKDEREHLRRALHSLFEAAAPKEQQAFISSHPDIHIEGAELQAAPAQAHITRSPGSPHLGESEHSSTSTSTPSVLHSPQQPLASDMSCTPNMAGVGTDGSTAAVAFCERTPDCVASSGRAGRVRGTGMSTSPLRNRRCVSTLSVNCCMQ